MLDFYLALPEAERDRFSLVYLLLRGRKPAQDGRAAFVDAAGVRIPVRLGPDGAVQTLPTLAQLKSKTVLEIDGGDYEFVLEPLAAIAPTARIDVKELAASLAQLNAALAKFARGQGGDVAKLTTAYFAGAASGEAILADGSSKHLSVFNFQALGPTPYFAPGKAPSVVAVTLDKPASRIVLAGPPI